MKMYNVSAFSKNRQQQQDAPIMQAPVIDMSHPTPSPSISGVQGNDSSSASALSGAIKGYSTGGVPGAIVGGLGGAMEGQTAGQNQNGNMSMAESIKNFFSPTNGTSQGDSLPNQPIPQTIPNQNQEFARMQQENVAYPSAISSLWHGNFNDALNQAGSYLARTAKEPFQNAYNDAKNNFDYLKAYSQKFGN